MRSDIFFLIAGKSFKQIDIGETFAVFKAVDFKI